MKKTRKKIAATAILMTVMSFSLFAESDMQCPKSANQCLADRSGEDTKTPINGDTKYSENLNRIIVKMLKAIGFPI